MSGDGLDDLFESLVPGAGRGGARPAEAPAVPRDLMLEGARLLGSGRTGWVYQATDPVLQRAVAVKIARPDRGAEAREELLREAQRTARLAHPAVLAIHRVVAADGLLCVVRQLAPTRTLADQLHLWQRSPASAPDPTDRLATLVIVADALAHAHRLGEVHGDLHPGQIAVDRDGHPAVLDWGGLGDERGVFSGAPEVAAPEQLAGEGASAAGDVFALAAVTAETLTGRPLRPPRPRDAIGPWLAQIRTEPVRPGLDGLDPALADVLGRALRADPAARPTAEELHRTMARVVTGRSEARRREAEAQEHLGRTRELLDAFHHRERQLEQEKRVVAVQQARVPSWAAAEEKKALWSAEDRVLSILDLQAATWTQALEEAVRATGLDPRTDDAHQLIAELWWERVLMAETRGYLGEAALARHRVATHDRGALAGRLEAAARLTVTAPGTLHRIVPGPRRWASRPVQSTPCEGARLPPGPYLLALDRADADPVWISLDLERHDDRHVDPTLPPADPEGFVFVAEGPCRLGDDPDAHDALVPYRPHVAGFWFGRHPVTVEEWLAFAAARPEAPAPSVDLPSGRRVPLWEGLPPQEALRHAVAGLTVAAAEAYAAWRSEVTGVLHRLPTEEEWEKAARGSDRRPYPWGTAFDPCLAHTRDSLRGGPAPGPVGAFPADTSTVGATDLAGGVREWTRTSAPGGRVVRGGSWQDDRRDARLASRHIHPDDACDPRVGFRLVREGP